MNGCVGGTFGDTAARSRGVAEVAGSAAARSSEAEWQILPSWATAEMIPSVAPIAPHFSMRRTAGAHQDLSISVRVAEP